MRFWPYVSTHDRKLSLLYLLLLCYPELNRNPSTVYRVIRPRMLCMIIIPVTYRVHHVNVAW